MFKSEIYYKQVLNEWLNFKRQSIKITTFCRYKSLVNLNIEPVLGNIMFKKINNTDINNFFEEKKIEELSNSTKKMLLIIIKSSINYGIKQKYRNKALIIEKKIKPSKARIVYLTKKEQKKLERYIYNHLNLRNLAILFDLYTGLRLGELCALQWGDIDFTNNTIFINKTVQRVQNIDNLFPTKTNLIITPPKTEHSIRLIPIPKFLITILKKYKNSQNIYVFSNNFQPKDPRAIEKYFKNLLSRLEIRNLVFHALRHTYATRAREAGIDIKILSELLGHSNYIITLNIYVHTSIDFKQDSVNSLVKYLKHKI